MKKADLFKYFKINSDLLSKIVKINDHTDLCWAIEDDHNPDTITIYLTVCKEDMYKYSDELLIKIITDNDLLYRTKDYPFTLVLEEYYNKHSKDNIFVATILNDKGSLFTTE